MAASRRWRAGLLVLLAAAAVAWVLTRRSPEAEDRATPSTSVLEAAPVGLAAGPSSPRVPPPEDGASGAAQDRTPELDRLIYVVSSVKTGRPLVDATVRLEAPDAELPHGRPIANGTTDGAGRAAFDLPETAFRAWFLAAGHAPRVVKGVAFERGEHRVDLSPGRDVEVRVRGRSGHVSEFRLVPLVADGGRAWDLPRVTSRAGAVTLPLPAADFAPEAALVVTAQAPGFSMTQHRWPLHDLPSSVDLEMEAARVVEVSVVDSASGQPVPEAALRVPLGPATTLTGADGRAALPLDGRTNDDGTVWVHVQKSGYEDHRQRVGAGDAQALIPLRPARPTVLVVIDAESRSVLAGARVTARASEIGGVRRGPTDPMGRIDLGVNLDMTWIVCVEHADYAPRFLALCAHAGQDDGAVAHEQSPAPEDRWPEETLVAMHRSRPVAYSIHAPTLDLKGAALLVDLDSNLTVLPSGRECYLSARAWNRFPPFLQTRRWPVRDGAVVEAQRLPPGTYEASLMLRSGVRVPGDLRVDPSGNLGTTRLPVRLTRR